MEQLYLVMPSENEIIIELIKLGLDKSSWCISRQKEDWSKVVERSLQHGVASIAFDGVQRCYDQIAFFPLDVETKLKWLGYVSLQELTYWQQEGLIAELARFYHKHGIKMMVLKGWGLSLNYPKPNHRPCTDLDIYLFGEQKRGDKLLSEELGIEIDNKHHHHSVFQYKDLSVENHYDFINVYSHLSNGKIEKRLKELVNEAVCKKMADGTEIWLPSADFNALFLLRHMASHFAGSEMIIRQILDWGLFIEKQYREVNWEELIPFIKVLNMHHFLGAVNYICYHYLGFDQKLFSFYVDESFGDRVFQELFNSENFKPKQKGVVMFIYSRFRKWWGNRWKHRIVYSEGLFMTFCVQVYAHLIKPASLHSI